MPFKFVLAALTDFGRRISDEARALETNLQELQPEFIQIDVLKQRQWALASGPGFYTYPHVDGSGLCTWVYLTEGTKLWSYLRPKLRQEDDGEDGAPPTEFRLSDVYQQYMDLARYSHEYNEAPTKMPKLADTHNLLLEPGVLL